MIRKLFLSIAVMGLTTSLYAGEYQQEWAQPRVCERPRICEEDRAFWGLNADLLFFQICQDGVVSILHQEEKRFTLALDHGSSVGFRVGGWWQPACSNWKLIADATVYSSTANQTLKGSGDLSSIIDAHIYAGSSLRRMKTRDVIDLQYLDLKVESNSIDICTDFALSFISGFRFVHLDRSFQAWGTIDGSNDFSNDDWKQSTFGAGLLLGLSFGYEWCGWKSSIDSSWGLLAASSDYKGFTENNHSFEEFVRRNYLNKPCHPIFISDIGLGFARSFCLCANEIDLSFGLNYEYWNSLTALRDLDDEDGTNCSDSLMITSLYLGIGFQF